MAKLDYSSGDHAALGPDETLLWSGTDRADPGGWRRVATVLGFSALGCTVISYLAVATLPEPRAVLVIIVTVCIGIGLVFLSARANLRFRRRERQVRFTNRRLVSRDTAANVQQLSHAELHEFAITLKRDVSHRRHGELVAGRRDLMEDEAIEEARAQDIAVPARDGDEADRLLRQMAASGLGEREAKRRWRRAWRPATVEQVPPMLHESRATSSTMSPVELLDGERVLWQGRPVLNWRRDLAARAIAILKSSPWILIAAAVTALPLIHPGARQGGLIVLVVIAGLMLFAQVMSHFWTPFQRVRQLRRTDYVLTSHRLIVRVSWSRATQIISTFFDADVRVSVDLLPDGRGTITLGYGAQLDLIADAAIIHMLALEAVAGFRQDPPAATAVAEPVT